MVNVRKLFDQTVDNVLLYPTVLITASQSITPSLLPTTYLTEIQRLTSAPFYRSYSSKLYSDIIAFRNALLPAVFFIALETTQYIIPTNYWLLNSAKTKSLLLIWRMRTTNYLIEQNYKFNGSNKRVNYAGDKIASKHKSHAASTDDVTSLLRNPSALKSKCLNHVSSVCYMCGN